MYLFRHLLSPAFRRNERVTTKFLTRRLKPGDAVEIKMYNPLMGGRLIIRDARLVEKRDYGVIVGAGAMMTSNDSWYDVTDRQHKETRGMYVTTADIFIPTRSMLEKPRKLGAS